MELRLIVQTAGSCSNQASVNDANFALAAGWITCFPERLFQILFAISGFFILRARNRQLTRQVISGTLLSAGIYAYCRTYHHLPRIRSSVRRL